LFDLKINTIYSIMDEENDYGFREPKPQKPAWWPSITAGIFLIIILII
tara:strand:- start:11570 stop:11713 length:144 start_codon:yes stop_codon:yes gene_type:complete